MRKSERIGPEDARAAAAAVPVLMSEADDDVLPMTDAAVTLTESEREAIMAEARALRAAHAERLATLRRDARASFRAVVGWR